MIPNAAMSGTRQKWFKQGECLDPKQAQLIFCKINFFQLQKKRKLQPFEIFKYKDLFKNKGC